MTITLTREEAQQVLDVLNDVRYRIEFGQMNLSDDTDAAIETLRARLSAPEPVPTNNGRYLTGYGAQPEPEPVAWMHDQKVGFNVPLYTAPPQREWQGLTDEERYLGDARSEEELEYAKAIEAKLKEKNT